MQSIMNLIYLLIYILRSNSIYTAFGCCQRVFLLPIVIGFSLSSSAMSASSVPFKSKYDSTQEQYQEIDNRLARNPSTSCQQSSVAYQEIYNFETENFYISVCQLENNFYYQRQSKIDLSNVLFIPARSMFGGKVFQATDGKTNYFVGRDGDRYYSSVMLNNNEIVFEPELPPEPFVFSPEIIDRDVAFSFSQIGSFDSHNWRSSKWKLNSAGKNVSTDSTAICTGDKSAFNSYFDGWHNLLGKTIDVANNYATSKGHNFIYEANSQEQAFIETKDGAIINLNIIVPDKIVDRVCVTPTAAN